MKRKETVAINIVKEEKPKITNYDPTKIYNLLKIQRNGKNISESVLMSGNYTDCLKNVPIYRRQYTSKNIQLRIEAQK